MEFVEERGIARQGGFKDRAQLLIGGPGISEPVALEDAAGVGVDYENGMPAGIKKDTVGRFRADAAEVEELFAKALGWRGEQSIERAGVLGKKKIDKALESFCLLAKVAGGTKARCKAGGMYRTNGQRIQQFRRTKVGDGAFHVFPGCVLRENRSDDDFERGTARPPMLRAISGKKGMEIAMQDRAASRFIEGMGRNGGYPGACGWPLGLAWRAR